MLSEKQIEEIREHLEVAQNPVFFYDNDADGLCSYILMRKSIGRGKGVAIRTHPDLDVGYVRKVQELGADYIFVLDRPYLGELFVEEIKKLQIPIVWIDHHDVEDVNYDYDNLFYFNPMKGRKKSSEPVTYWTYKVTNRIEDVWIAVMGCIADHYFPDFSKDFNKRWPEYWGNVKEPFDAYYRTGIGSLARSLAFGLKDSITHVIYLQKFLISCKSPADFFLELDSGSSFGKNYRELKKKYDALIRKAEKGVGDKVIFFRYGGDLSISSEISNYFSHKYPEHRVVIAYDKGTFSNLSLRGKKVKIFLDKLLPRFKDSRGGGHEEAVGARVLTEDLERFKNEFEEEVFKD